LSDQPYLLNQQYHDASNLNARIELHVRFSTNRYGWLRWVFDQLSLPERCRILELGCGPGRLWLDNLARILASWDITLSDFSPGMLDEARRNLGDGPRPFRFEVIDAQSIPFDDEQFDAVIANHMLFHVPDRARALAEIRRVLRPGGRFYAATNGRAHLQEIEDLVHGFYPDAVKWREQMAQSFTLETGAVELARWFAHVSLRRYEDGLVVTEAGPLVAYVLSGLFGASFSGEQSTQFRRFVEDEIAAHGAIRITKDSGLFEAY
jgi:SAM-dependent methyltransferase